jgi:hypothetical protein
MEQQKLGSGKRLVVSLYGSGTLLMVTVVENSWKKIKNVF